MLYKEQKIAIIERFYLLAQKSDVHYTRFGKKDESEFF